MAHPADLGLQLGALGLGAQLGTRSLAQLAGKPFQGVLAPRLKRWSWGSRHVDRMDSMPRRGGVEW